MEKKTISNGAAFIIITIVVLILIIAVGRAALKFKNDRRMLDRDRERANERLLIIENKMSEVSPNVE